MKKVELFRMPGDGSATHGIVLIDGVFICYTIENTKKLYPSGEYVMRLGGTGKTMPKEYVGMAYEVLDVEGRTQIKWHVANYFYQLEGCTAPNMNLYATAKHSISGGSSMLATALFMDTMKDENGQLAEEAELVVRDFSNAT